MAARSRRSSVRRSPTGPSRSSATALRRAPSATSSDLIEGIIALAGSGYHDPVNIGNPDEFSLLQLAEIVREITGASSEIIYEALPEDDPSQRRPDISLAGELLDWAPKVNLREGLRRTIEQASVETLIGR